MLHSRCCMSSRNHVHVHCQEASGCVHGHGLWHGMQQCSVQSLPSDCMVLAGCTGQLHRLELPCGSEPIVCCLYHQPTSAHTVASSSWVFVCCLCMDDVQTLLLSWFPCCFRSIRRQEQPGTAPPAASLAVSLVPLVAVVPPMPQHPLQGVRPSCQQRPSRVVQR
jgi:hypothetical protein